MRKLDIHYTIMDMVSSHIRNMLTKFHGDVFYYILLVRFHTAKVLPYLKSEA